MRISSKMEPSRSRWLEPFEWLLMGVWLCLWLCRFRVEQAGEEANDVDLDVKAYARGGGG